MLKTALQVWFRLSIFALLFVLGWSLANYELSLVEFIVRFMALAGIGFILYSKKTSFIIEYTFYCTAMLLGSSIAGSNLFNAHNWMVQSVNELHASVAAQQALEELDTSVYQKQLDDFLKNFHVLDHDLPNPIVVSFDRNGIVLFNGKEAKLLTEPKKHMLSEVLPDNTMIYSTGLGLESVQGLFRSKLEGDTNKVLWAKSHARLYLHHWGDVFKDRFYHPGRKFVKVPNETSRKIGGLFSHCRKEDSRWDVVRIFDFDTGDYIEGIELVEMIANMEGGEDLKKMVRLCGEPLHLNSVQIVKNRREANYFPNGKVGDMLVSLRDTHTILLIDKDTHEPKWYVLGGRENGKFIAQHSPRITNRGTILLVDNLGSDPQNGKTRITEIDIATKESVGHYQATGDEFYQSALKGKIEIDGNRIYVLDEFKTKKNKTDTVSLFYIDCPPNSYISDNCVRTDILSGNSNHYNYNNAAIIPVK